MKILFEKVVLHNFLSYSHSEIDLTDRQYCLVSGINNCKADYALSNGAGKSTFSTAICYALTGATIQGVTKQLKNNLIDEKLCYVELYFSADGNKYKVIRYAEPKSDLKIWLNGNDISGKTFTESKEILAQYLPDLTSSLISSVIILGQGLPAKFSSNSPSGRKEVLEKLSKSDYMIEDIKKRISKRTEELNSEIRKYEDEILKYNTQKSIYEKQKNDLELDLQKLSIKPDFDSIIKNTKEEIEKIEIEIQTSQNIINETSKKISDENEKYTKKLNDKNAELLKENNDFNECKNQFNLKVSEKNSLIKSLNDKIKTAKNIKDICPTCGQKIPNVIKPDTSQDEAQVKVLNEEVTALNDKYIFYLKEHNNSIEKITLDYSKDISDISFNIKNLKDKNDLYSRNISLKTSDLTKYKVDLQKVISEKENYENNLKNIQTNLYNLNLSIDEVDKKILYNNNEKDNVSVHLSVVNQMNTLVKRDFRGFLLSNVISFINSKSKEYCKTIFGTNELEFSLDGNNIDITYLGKNFENLSGGEKQKVDLIIQFAIRDMMEQYLGFSSNILVLDEIFDNLDALATESVIKLIADRFNDIESLFIISHHSQELNIPYDTELIVIKDESGISHIK